MTVLTCERCDTKFEVPDKALTGGRKVRCTNCLYIWYQEDPNAPPSDFEAELNAAHEAAEAVPDAVRPAGETDKNVIITEDEETRKLSTRAALFVFVSLALIACIMLLAVEKKITAVWPQSVSLYRAIGIQAAPPWEGFRVEAGRAVFSGSDAAAPDEGLLIVEATVTNMTDAPKTLPPFRVELTDISSGEVLQSWEPAAEETVIEAGQSKTVKWGFTDARHKMGRVRLFFRHFD